LWVDPTIRPHDQRKRRRRYDLVDGGKNWTTQGNQPTAQFYHVAADNDFLYRLYGSQQDNSSIGIRTRSDRGFIDRGDWDAVGGGESGYVVLTRATPTSFTPTTRGPSSRASIAAPVKPRASSSGR